MNPLHFDPIWSHGNLTHFSTCAARAQCINTCMCCDSMYTWIATWSRPREARPKTTWACIQFSNAIPMLRSLVNIMAGWCLVSLLCQVAAVVAVLVLSGSQLSQVFIVVLGPGSGSIGSGGKFHTKVTDRELGNSYERPFGQLLMI